MGVNQDFGAISQRDLQAQISLVVIVYPIAYQGKEVVAITAGDQIQLVLHMPEEALVGRIVPAVGFPGHGLAQMIIPDDLNEFQTCIVGPLIAVDQGFCL